MTKIYANEMLNAQELDNIFGGAPTKIPMAPESSNPYESLARGVANAITAVMMYFFETKKKK